MKKCSSYKGPKSVILFLCFDFNLNLFTVILFINEVIRGVGDWGVYQKITWWQGGGGCLKWSKKGWRNLCTAPYLIWLCIWDGFKVFFTSNNLISRVYKVKLNLEVFHQNNMQKKTFWYFQKTNKKCSYLGGKFTPVKCPLHTCILAYLYTCILVYLHTCIFAYLHNCILLSFYKESLIEYKWVGKNTKKGI